MHIMVVDINASTCEALMAMAEIQGTEWILKSNPTPGCSSG